MFEDMDFGDSLERGDPDLWDELFHKNIGLWMRAAGRCGFYGNDAKRIIGIAAAEFIKQLNQGKDGHGHDMPMLIEGDLEKLKKKFANKVGTIAKRERKEGPEPDMKLSGADEDEDGHHLVQDSNPDPAESHSKAELRSLVLGLAGEECEERFREYIDAQSELSQMNMEEELVKKITDTLVFEHIAKPLTVSWRAIQKRFIECKRRMVAAAKRTRADKEGTRYLYNDLVEMFG